MSIWVYLNFPGSFLTGKAVRVVVGTKYQVFAQCLACVWNRWLPLLFMVTPSVLFRVCWYWCIHIPPPETCTISGHTKAGQAPSEVREARAGSHRTQILHLWTLGKRYSVSQSGMCLWHQNRSIQQIVWNKMDIFFNCGHLRK